MKKLISIIIIMTILVITGCSKKDIIKHNYTFKGENESWTAEYKINGTQTFIKEDTHTKFESEAQKELLITYKNDISELSSVKHIEISYKSTPSSGKIVEDYTDGNQPKKTYKFQSSSKGAAIENQDDIIEVTVNIDGNIEVFELKNEE